MFQSIATAVLLFVSFYAQASNRSFFDIEEAKERCQVHHSKSKELYRNKLKDDYTLEELSNLFAEVYDSGERLAFHSYYSPEDNEFYIYHELNGDLRPVKIDENFIKSVTLHIETAIEQGFADYVFYPDMGHAHLYFLQEHWDANYRDVKYTTDTVPYFYEKMLGDPKMEVLYHLSERLETMDENKEVIQQEDILFKYYNRNFLANNNASRDYQIKQGPADLLNNTFRNYEGHKDHYAGYAMSASNKGCFPYRDKNGEKKYFDLGLLDPRQDPKTYSYGGY